MLSYHYINKHIYIYIYIYIFIYIYIKSEVREERNINDCNSPTCLEITESMLDLMDDVSYIYI